MGAIKLKTKFAILIGLLLLVALVVNIIWTTTNKRAQMENELREQGQALSQQMDAVWEFMVANQGRLEKIAYTDDGVYQGLHCAIAGRSIGNMFSSETEYTTRFVNFNPRNSADEPDDWEAAALTAFNNDDSCREYYGFSSYRGEEVFRYSAPMTIESKCLQCHGEPAGELDVTGAPKEGWTIGDIGGAISIVMPLDVYKESERISVIQDVVFYIGVIALALVAVYLGLTVLVTRPLKRISDGVEQMQSGNMDFEFRATQSSREMNKLMREFNSMADKLSKTYGNLEAQVSDRTAELAYANSVLKSQQAQLEKANSLLQVDNQYKSEFLSMMSHELRTPLTSIVAFTEMLNSDTTHPISEKEAEARKEIEINSRILLLMIEDILEMSRVDAGKAELVIETVDLGDLFGMVASVVRPLAERGKVNFSIEVSPDTPLIQGDFDKLRHVFENLCGNAVKFTPDGGSVVLTARWDAMTQAEIVEVKDTGIGIEVEDQERIFDKFVQADSSSARRYNGTGLGLSLAKEYTEMHGGTIALESEPGKGSTFIVILPQSAAEETKRGGEE